MIAARSRRALLYMASIVGGLAAWEFAAQGVSRIIVAPPTAVAVSLFDGIWSGRIPQAFAASLGHMIPGLTIAFTIALALSLALGRSRAVADYLDPVLSALYAIPPVAFVPIIIVWCGFEFGARVTLVALMSFFEMLFTFSAGARNIPPGLIDVGRSFGARRWSMIRSVMLPSMLPFVLTGFRLGLIRAIHGMIVAELFFRAANLGQIMKRSAAHFDSAGVLAIIAVLAAFGLVTNESLKALEWRMLSQKRA
jgi:ABC-type nitrate/sulfonate/bicarbonate transport system permease component